MADGWEFDRGEVSKCVDFSGMRRETRRMQRRELSNYSISADDNREDP